MEKLKDFIAKTICFFIELTALMVMVLIIGLVLGAVTSFLIVP